jgi:mannitol/fructose-specific phosphotransferase system IIA component (Ntr-type)
LSLTKLKLSELISLDQIHDINPTSKGETLQFMCSQMAKDSRVLDGEALFEAILERERQVSTGVGLGIAIPHVKIPQITDYVMTVGRVKAGMDFEALDGQPVHLIFMIGASDRQTKEYVKILARVTHLLKSEGVRQALMEAEIATPFLEIIRTHESA